MSPTHAVDPHLACRRSLLTLQKNATVSAHPGIILMYYANVGGSAIALFWRLRGDSGATQCGTSSESQCTTWNGRSGIWRHIYSVEVACPTATTTRIKLTRPNPVAVFAVIKLFYEFKRGHAPSALGHDHCQHAMVRKAEASARHPSLIEMQGLWRIAGIFATQINR